MNNRLQELKNFKQYDSGSNDNHSSGLKASQIDLESQASEKEELSSGIVPRYFQEDVSSARVLIEKIKANTTEVDTLRSQYSFATRNAKEKEISEQIEVNLNDNRKHAQQLKKLLDKMKDDIEETKLDKDRQGDAGLKQNLYNSISAATRQVLLDSQEAQEKYRQGLRSKTSRQIKHLAPEMSDEQIEEIADNPEQANQIFEQKMFKGASQQLQNAVSDAKDKYKDILKLEKSIQELHQLMIDIATMVAAQGELIENIQANVASAKKNVVKANVKLGKAKEHHISARKKQCCLIAIGAIIVVVILVFVLK